MAKYKTNKSKYKISLLMLFFSYLLRPFTKRKGVFCFVAQHSKPWGCNLEAYALYLQANPCTRTLYILNMGETPQEDIANEFSQFNSNVQVIDIKEKFLVFKCVCQAETFFFGDYVGHGIPGEKINLWHGIPLKKIGVLQADKYKKLGRRYKNVISAASKMDQMNMSKAFHMGFERVIPCGLPRHDWILGDLHLPLRFQSQLEKLSNILADRKLVLYAPTFRDKDHQVFPLSKIQLKKWAELLSRKGYVLGVRLHLISRSQLDLDELGIIDLSGDNFNHIEAIYRSTEILVTDYSSVSIDFMLTNKLIVGLDPSEEKYDRGFIGDFDVLFPGHFFNKFDLFLDYLQQIIDNPERSEERFDYSFQKRLFFGNYENDACKKLTETLFD